MVVDAVAGPLLDLTHDGPPAGVIDVTAGAAVRADHVVVVDGLAGYVGMLTGRQVEALDRVEIGQDVERPEDRRATDAEPPLAGVRHEVGRREMPVARGDQVGDRAACLGQPVSGVVERGLDGGRCGHSAE